MTQYKTRTAGTKRLTRDLKRETPLGVLAVGWHNGKIKGISVSPTSVRLDVVDSFGDKINTQLFIRRFDSSNTINERLKALLAAASMDANELMTLADGIIDGEFHMLGSLEGRSVRVQVDWNGEQLDIVRFARPSAPTKKKTMSF